MTTEEWIDATRRQCQSALSEADIRQVGALLDEAGFSGSAQREALESTAKAHSPSPSLMKWGAFIGQAGLALDRFPLERKLLLDQALIALPQISTLPVDETVKQLFCTEIMFMAEPSEDALPRFALNVYTFAAMARLVFLERFPAGHYHWEVSGFPKTWFPRIPLRLLPLTLRFLLLEARGLRPWFVSHMRGTGAGNPFLVESEFRKSFYRMALALEKQPHIQAVMAQSWLHSPETHRVSPHLAFLNEVLVEAGGIITDLGPAVEEDGFATGVRRRIIRESLSAKCEPIGINRVRTEQARGFQELRIPAASFKTGPDIHIPLCLVTPAALAPVTPLGVALNNTHRLRTPFFTAGKDTFGFQCFHRSRIRRVLVHVHHPRHRIVRRFDSFAHKAVGRSRVALGGE